ncbi:MAG: creatininase family protein [Candidatus Njordarchaeales archaeon]
MSLIRFDELTWEEVQKEIKHRIVIIPIGAVEAHGPHLPLNTDTVIVQKIAEEVAKRTRSLLLPVLNYGQLWSLKNFPGSIRIKEENIVAFLVDICESLHAHGAKLIVLISWHLGNANVIKKVARIMHDKHGVKVLYFLAPGIKEMRKMCESKQWHPTYFHAEEIETSLMLAIRPDLVNMNKAISSYPSPPQTFGYLPHTWDEFTSLGVLGDPTKATAEKGKKMLNIAINAVVSILQKFSNSE